MKISNFKTGINTGNADIKMSCSHINVNEMLEIYLRGVLTMAIGGSTIEGEINITAGLF